LLLGPAVSGSFYTLWKWVQLELRNIKISFMNFYNIGIKELVYYIKKTIGKMIR
jgi:hypothetical protein